MELLPGRVDGIFLSPPWGGTDYLDVGPDSFDICCISVNSDGASENWKDLLQMALDALPNSGAGGAVAYLLPRNIDGMSLAQASFSVGLREIELEQNYLRMKLKTIIMSARCGRGFA
ncbi:hypothetical protein ACA910_006262 [Epithemia clementina (nom. ined.)]